MAIRSVSNLWLRNSALELSIGPVMWLSFQLLSRVGLGVLSDLLSLFCTLIIRDDQQAEEVIIIIIIIIIIKVM